MPPQVLPHTEPGTLPFERFVTIVEAAAFLGVARKTLERMIRAKKLPVIPIAKKTRGGRSPVRIWLPDLLTLRGPKP